MKQSKCARFKRALKLFFAVLFALFILINGILGLYIYFNQESLKSRLIQYVNTQQKGELSANGISLSPLKHFPSISIELRDVAYFDSDSSSAEINSVPICRFERFYIAFDLLQLFHGNIRISEATAENGNINLRIYPDSSFNLLNAVSSPGEISQDSSVQNPDDSVKIDFSLKRIHFNNIDFQFKNDLSQRKTLLHLNDLKTQLIYNNDSLNCQADADIELMGYYKGNKILFKNIVIGSSLSFQIDLRKKIALFHRSQLDIQGTLFDLDGRFDFSEDGSYFFNISGSDDDMSFYRLILREDIIEKNIGNLKKGDLFFSGRIEGKARSNFVYSKFSFGVKNIHIDIDDSVEPIDRLHFKGIFTTGRKEDYSEAHFVLKDFEASLPNGHLSGNIEITNFAVPQISLDLSAKIDLEKIDKVFKLNKYLNNLKGNLSIESKLEGYYDPQKGHIIRKEEKSEIKLDHISFALPDSGYNVDLLDGEIVRTEDKYFLHNLHFIRGSSDVIVNGSLSKLIYLFFKEDAPVYAQLDIHAKRLIIKELIGQDKSESIILNDTLSHVNLNADVHTTAAALRSINNFPQSTINIHELSARLQTTPDIYKGNGTLVFTDSLRIFNIGFKNIKLQTSTGNLKVNGDLLISDSTQQKIAFLTELSNFNISKTKKELHLVNLDLSFLDSLTGNMNTNFDFLIGFTPDSFETRQFSMKNWNAAYTPPSLLRESVSASDIDLFIKDMRYDPLNNDLKSFQGSLHFNKLSLAKYRFHDIGLHFEKDNDLYKIETDIAAFLGNVKKKEYGMIYIDVSDSIPSYEVHFRASDFKIEKIMEDFSEKKIIDGKVTLEFQLTSKGTDIDQLLMNLKGEAATSGQNLIFYGVNLDHILDKIQRFQSFNLVDISAYFIAGPLAPLATKGFDAASIITTSLGDKTHVSRLISKWAIKDGLATIKDAALTTSKNRIAAKGGINILKGAYNDITVAVLNRRGCSLISQKISGPFTDPKLGKLDAVGPIRGTIESLFNAVTGKECTPFYTGSLAHPN